MEVITTSEGVLVEYFIVAGTVHDTKAFEAINVDLPKASSLYADSAYTNYELEELYLECGQVTLLPQRKSNSRRPDTPAMKFIKQTMRKKVEAAFSGIESAFPKAIHTVTPQGFLLKIVLFLFAYTIDKCL